MHIFCLDYTVSASKSYPLRVQNKLTTSSRQGRAVSRQIVVAGRDPFRFRHSVKWGAWHFITLKSIRRLPRRSYIRVSASAWCAPSLRAITPFLQAEGFPPRSDTPRNLAARKLGAHPQV